MLFGLLVLLGLLLTTVLEDVPPISDADSVVRGLVAGRSGPETALSGFFSHVARPAW